MCSKLKRGEKRRIRGRERKDVSRNKENEVKGKN